MTHHLMNERELRTFCIYCKSEVPLDGWKSDWHSETHYKTTKCTCGKDLHIKVDFGGSGHDSWNGKKFTSKISKNAKEENIEDRIKTIEQPKVVARHFPKK